VNQFHRTGQLASASARWLLLLVFLTLALPVGAASDPVTSAPEIQGSVHSPKKGLGITTRKYPDWEQRLTRLNIAWFYTWRAEVPGRPSGSVEFVPMAWGRGSVNEQNLADLGRGGREGRYRNLLGFNEPDLKRQANIPVEEAVRLWSRLAATGLRLGSPAAVNAHNPWMRAFMAGVEREGGRVDFIAVHWYGGPHAEKFLKHLGYVHQRYGRPIWITEFAVADWDARTSGVGRYSPEQALAFMQAVIPALERLDYVERYAWFSASPDHPALGQSALFDYDGALTPLGRTYAGY
jgi:putative glycosyl hydrolase